MTRRRLLLVHAHPDDETLTTGGTIARYAAEPDTSVTLVTCTLGEQGEVIPAELGMLVAEQADQLGGYRIGELAAACAALGLTDHRFLGGPGRWRDSGMALSGDGLRATLPERVHPRALARPEAFDEQVDALVEVLEQVRPQVVVSYGPDGGYGHPDHVRAHEITVAAVARVPARLVFTVVTRSSLAAGVERISALPDLPFRLPAPDELPAVDDRAATARLDVSGQRAARVAALRAHATQVQVWESDGPAVGPAVGTVVWALSNGIARPLLDTEEYTIAEEHPGLLDDLFAGLPDMIGVPPMSPAAQEGAVLGVLLLDAILLGAFGLAFTPLYVGAVPVPLGPVLVILILPWLVLRAAEIDPRSGVAASPMWAWLLTVLLLGLWGPGGDAMLPMAPTTVWMSLLLIGGGLMAALAALRYARARPPTGQDGGTK